LVIVPQREQPVRAVKVAALVAALAQVVPRSPPGTQVMPPEWVWLASQQDDPQALVQAWLAGTALPLLATPTPRM
jgi:hypothetical protein